MKIREFFETLWYHRSIIQALTTDVNFWHKEAGQYEGATQTLSHALIYITTPPTVEEEKPVALKPVFQRRTYREQQVFVERQMSARFREMDAAKARKANQ